LTAYIPQRHLWYLSEELVALALFDLLVSVEKRQIHGSVPIRRNPIRQNANPNPNPKP